MLFFRYYIAALIIPRLLTLVFRHSTKKRETRLPLFYRVCEWITQLLPQLPRTQALLEQLALPRKPLVLAR